MPKAVKALKQKWLFVVQPHHHMNRRKRKQNMEIKKGKEHCSQATIVHDEVGLRIKECKKSRIKKK